MKINRTTQRTIEILDLIATSEEDLTLNDVSKTLGIPKTSAFDILETLVHLNMIYIKEHRLKTYAIGVKAYAIGNSYSKTSLLLTSSSPIIKKLSQDTGLTVLIAKEYNGKILYTAKQEPLKKVIVTPEIGHRGSLHTTGAGKAILAYSQNKLDLMNSLNLVARTERTLVDKDVLQQQLDDIQALGYAVSDREHEEHTFSIGVPIFDYNGVASASVEVVGLYREGYDLTEDIALVKQAAIEISKLQGWSS